MVASHDDTKIYFNILPTTTTKESSSPTANNDNNEHEPETKRPKIEKEEEKANNFAQSSSSLVSCDRACQLNDTSRIRSLWNGIKYALSCKSNGMVGEEGSDSNAVVLDISDFSLCGIIAALLGASNVTSLETSSNENIPMASARVAQIANNLPLPIPATTSISIDAKGEDDNIVINENDKKKNVFQIVQCHAEHLSLDILGGKPANVVVAEPYYEILEGWHLQEALNYYYLLRSLKSRGLISPATTSGFVSVPSYARVMGCTIQATELSTAYKRCDPELMGFNHDVINQYGNRFHEYDLSLPMWNYNYDVLSDGIELARIEYDGTSNAIVNNGAWIQAPFNKSGACHALLSWIEYVIRTGEDQTCVISTKSGTSYRQIVRMLREPEVITENDIQSGIKFCCRATIGGLEGSEDHQFDLLVKRD